MKKLIIFLLILFLPGVVAAQMVSDLPAVTEDLASDDLIPVVDTSAGTSGSKKLTYAQLITNLDGDEVHVLSPIIMAEPDQLQPIADAWPLYQFLAEKYSSGVTITSIHVKTSAACTDALNFEEWAQQGTSAASTVETFTLSGTYTEDDGTLADADIAADGWLYVDLVDAGAGCDIGWFAITISFIEQ